MDGAMHPETWERHMLNPEAGQPQHFHLTVTMVDAQDNESVTDKFTDRHRVCCERNRSALTDATGMLGYEFLLEVFDSNGHTVVIHMPCTGEALRLNIADCMCPEGESELASALAPWN